MKKATETRGSFDLTAEALAVLMDANADVLLGLSGLRLLGEHAVVVVGEVLDLPELKKLRIGLELFEALTIGSDLDPEAFLLDYIAFDDLETARHALLGIDSAAAAA
ncbi:MAG: hypothetical protein GY788_01570 [bacterium]|nr:hypothetical protein [bacterium]